MMPGIALHTGDGTVIDTGTALAPTVVELDRVAVVMGAATTNTFFEGHIDPEYAKRQGRRDIYLATGAVAGLVDRYVLNWLGPEAFLRSRSLRMRSSLCAGDVATLTGTVVSVEPSDGPGRGRQQSTPVAVVTFQVAIANETETCVTASVSTEVPLTSGDLA